MIHFPPRALRRSLAALLAALTAGSALAPAPGMAQVRLPSLGESAGEDFTAGAERRLGDQIMRDIRRDPAYLDDPLLLEYVQSLWRPLVAAARQRGEISPDVATQFAWETFLVRDRSVNAFALPGGWVGVHLGLIAMTTTRDELASVLAHELTHVSQRHIARGVDNSSRASLIGLAAMIVGMIAASRSGSADIANAAIMTGQGAAVQGQLNFSRDMEREADRIGFGILSDAGFSPAGMASMFERLAQANRLNDSQSFPYLRSHPLTVERISEARSRALGESMPAPQATLEHQLMQAIARVRMDPSAAGLRRQVEQIGVAPSLAPTEQIAALAGGALAASMLGEHERARTAIDDAWARWSQAAASGPAAGQALSLLRSQVLLAAGDASGSLRTLDAQPHDGRASLLLRADAVLALQRTDPGAAAALLRPVAERLQTWVVDHPQDAGAWSRLARVHEALGAGLRSVRAQAEAQAALGDLGGAIDRLVAGQRAARATDASVDHIEASVIDARLRELRAQRRQMILDAGGRIADESPR